MFGKWKRYVLMDEAGGGAAGGGAAAAGAGSEGAAGSGGGAADPAGAAGASGAGAGGTAAGGVAATGSALAAGAAGEATAASGAANADWVPEKYRVAKSDGTIDVEASARKLAEAHGTLVKKMVDGGAPPTAATDYQVVVPDALKDAVGDLSKDEMFTQFRADMHGLGLSQKQFDGVMARYFELAPKLAAGGSQVTGEQAIAELTKKWPDEGERKKQISLGYNAAGAVARAAGMTFDDIEKSGLGNNPTFIKLMAAIGPEIGEDKAVTGAPTAGLSSQADIEKLLASDANLNTKHPDHAATRARVNAFYERKYGNQQIA